MDIFAKLFGITSSEESNRKIKDDWHAVTQAEATRPDDKSQSQPSSSPSKSPSSISRRSSDLGCHDPSNESFPLSSRSQPNTPVNKSSNLGSESYDSTFAGAAGTAANVQDRCAAASKKVSETELEIARIFEAELPRWEALTESNKAKHADNALEVTTYKRAVFSKRGSRCVAQAKIISSLRWLFATEDQRHRMIWALEANLPPLSLGVKLSPDTIQNVARADDTSYSKSANRYFERYSSCWMAAKLWQTWFAPKVSFQ